MNIDEAYAAGRAAALRGEVVTNPPLLDDLFLAWIRGYREHQTFDAACDHCRGTGRRRAGGEGPYASSELICSCDVARCPTEPKSHDHAAALVDALTDDVASER